MRAYARARAQVIYVHGHIYSSLISSYVLDTFELTTPVCAIHSNILPETIYLCLNSGLVTVLTLLCLVFKHTVFVIILMTLIATI